MLEQAARAYLARREGIERPDGKNDSGGRWHPSEVEKRECCEHVLSPSRAWPSSLYNHCRTLRHVAQLYGVDESTLRTVVRRIEKEE